MRSGGEEKCKTAPLCLVNPHPLFRGSVWFWFLFWFWLERKGRSSWNTLTLPLSPLRDSIFLPCTVDPVCRVTLGLLYATLLPPLFPFPPAFATASFPLPPHYLSSTPPAPTPNIHAQQTSGAAINIK